MDAQGSVENAKEDTVFFGEIDLIPVEKYYVDRGTPFDDTTDAIDDDGSPDVSITLAISGVGLDDAVYVGSSSPYTSVVFHMAEGLTGTLTYTWEYWDGSSWSALTVLLDATEGFTVAETYCPVVFTVPNDWATTTVSTSGSLYYVRARISSFTSISARANCYWVKTSTTVITEDLSQYGTDLSIGDAGGYELTSARTAITGATGREVYVRCRLEAAEADAILIAHHASDLSGMTFLIFTDGSGNLALVQDALDVLWTSSATVPAGDLSIAWSTRANPDTTGSSDALISEVMVYDHTAGDYVEIAQFTHAVPSTNSSWTFSVGGAWDGSAMFNPPTYGPTAARVSLAFHSAAEFAEDWIAERDAHSHTLEQPVEPIGAGLDVGGQGEWAGQANVGFAAAHANALRCRMLSPMVGEVYVEARELSTTPDPTQWIIGAPGSSGYKMDATMVRWLPCDGWDYAEVWVQVQSWVTTGSAVPVGVRVYAMNRPHVGLGVKLEGQPMPALEYQYVGDVIEEDHTDSGEGEWMSLGTLKLARLGGSIEGWAGGVVVCPAYMFDPEAASANDANALLKIKAVALCPVVGEP